MGLSRATSAAVLCGVTAAAVMLVVRWRRRTRMPTKWRRVGEISEVAVYPLKSGKAVFLTEAECTDSGLRTTEDHPQRLRDRFLMVFNEKNRTMVTARQHPNMVLITVTSTDGNTVRFQAPDMPDLELKLAADGAKKFCKMWFGEQVQVLDCGEAPADWLCRYLQKGSPGLRLGCHLPGVLLQRDLSKKPWTAFYNYYKNMRGDDVGAFCDLSTFMLMSEASVAEVRSRLATPMDALSARWFRPNLVVRGPEPYAEDSWDWLRLGEDAVFRCIKPCTRCVMITVDPETGVKDSAMEPLKTLKSYRLLTDPVARKVEGDAPAIGVNLGLRRAGRVSVGAAVYVGEH